MLTFFNLFITKKSARVRVYTRMHAHARVRARTFIEKMVFRKNGTGLRPPIDLRRTIRAGRGMHPVLLNNFATASGNGTDNGVGNSKPERQQQNVRTTRPLPVLMVRTYVLRIRARRSSTGHGFGNSKPERCPHRHRQARGNQMVRSKARSSGPASR